MLVLALSCSAFASAPDTEQPQDATSVVWWEYEVTPTNVSYGSWSEAGEGAGPGTLERSVSYSESHSVSISLNGKQSDLEAELGFVLNKSYTYTSTYSVSVPAGKTYTILYRSKYQNYSVKEIKYRMVIATGETTVVQTRTGTAKEVLGPSFGYRDNGTGKIYF